MSSPSEDSLKIGRKRLLALENKIRKELAVIDDLLAEIKPLVHNSYDSALFYRFGQLRGQHQTLIEVLKDLRRATTDIGNWDHDSFKVKTER